MHPLRQQYIDALNVTPTCRYFGLICTQFPIRSAKSYYEAEEECVANFDMVYFAPDKTHHILFREAMVELVRSRVLLLFLHVFTHVPDGIFYPGTDIRNPVGLPYREDFLPDLMPKKLLNQVDCIAVLNVPK